MLTFEKIKTLAIPILLSYKVSKAYLFGAYARNEQNMESDIDILIIYEADARPTLFTLAAMKYDLENLFKRKVDIVTETAISPYIKSYIMMDRKEIM